MAFAEYNPNPAGKNVGDCVIRALTKALGKTWEQVYVELSFQGFMMSDVISANNVWGAYLYDRGFEQKVIPNTCPDCYTIWQFCEDYPQGTYVLATGSHAVAVVDGNYYDSYDSGSQTPIYVWVKEEK